MVGHVPAMGIEWSLQQRRRWENGASTPKRVKWDPHLTPPTKINAR